MKQLEFSFREVIEYKTEENGRILTFCPFNVTYKDVNYNSDDPNTIIRVGSYVCSEYCLYCLEINSKNKEVKCGLNK